MILFAAILLIPLLVAVGCYLLSTGITWRELMAQAGAQLLIAAASVAVCSCQDTADTEVWNGRVTGKERVQVSCSHSYSCHCRPASCGKNCTTVHCDTCYHHTHDWDWRVYSSTGNQWNIRRIDWQGTYEPPRWTQVQVGDPTSETHSYKNPIKAAPDTLFRHQGLTEKYASNLPEYPLGEYDYYRIDRLVLVNDASVEEPKSWNSDIAEVNAAIGVPKQANTILVLVRGLPRDYFSALEEAWLGGKKNDVVLVVGVDSERKPQWAEVMAWTVNPMVKVKLRDAVMALPTIERWNVTSAMRESIVAHYKRKPMADFEYLASSVTPSVTQWVVTLLIGLLCAVGLSWVFHHEDVFGEEKLAAWRKRWS